MTELFKFLVTAPEAVILLLYLVVPGYIATKIYDILAPGERRGFGEAIIDILAWSFILMLFWFWPFAALYQYSDLLSTWVRYLIAFVLTILAVFVTPPLAALLLYRVRHHGFLKTVAKGESSHPSPTSWDWFFSEEADNYYVRFHFKTGEKLGGYYGENSFATSFPNKQEIYVEEAWQLDEDGNFIEPIEETKGAFVYREDCTLVEFFEVRETSRNQESHKSIDSAIAEEPGSRVGLLGGEGYQSGKQNSPNRLPPGREHH